MIGLILMNTVTKWEPTDLGEFFLKLQALDMILVGGQAINLWSLHYQRKDPHLWAKYLPFTSEDLDFLGGRTEALACGKLFVSETQVNDGTDPSPNADVILIPWRGIRLRIDILTSVYGLSTTDVEQNALTYQGHGSLAGISIKILHPVHCVESKAANLANLPQAHRQDEKQLELSLLVLNEFLKEPTLEPRRVLRLCERIYAIALNRTGREVFLKAGIELEKAVPVEYFKHQPSFQLFLERRHPQLKEELHRKRSGWLPKALQSCPPKTSIILISKLFGADYATVSQKIKQAFQRSFDRRIQFT